MTTLELNRATVLLFCASLSRRDFTGMAKLVTEDATWWVIGRPDYAPYGGLRPFTDVMKVVEALIGPFDEFAFTVQGTIAEDDRVAVEATSWGRNGTAGYSNTYLMRYELQEGKIRSVREFFDAYEITAYLRQLGADSGSAFASLDCRDAASE